MNSGVWPKHYSYIPLLLCSRIISSAEDVMERSLHLIEEARQALKNPDSPSNASNLTQVAKDVSQVSGWNTSFFDSVFSVCMHAQGGGEVKISKEVCVSVSIAAATGVLLHTNPTSAKKLECLSPIHG